MKYLFFQTVVVFLCAMFLLFLFQQESFLPFDGGGEINWYNLSTVFFFLFLLVQGFLSIALFLFQKFFTCGLKEFPSYGLSLKWGIIVSFLFILVLLLNIYHVVNFLWGAIIAGLLILFLILIKI